MQYIARIVDGTGHTEEQKNFDRFDRAEKWAVKRLAKINEVFHTCTIYKYGDSTGGNLWCVSELSCTREMISGRLIVS